MYYLGFLQKNWKSEVKGKNKVKFICVSLDGDEGYFGEIIVSVIFTFNDDNEFKLNYKVRIEFSIIVNLINYGYFNLVGQVWKEFFMYIIIFSGQLL